MTKPLRISQKVAVIEDEISIQQMYRFRLEQEGFEVAVANNGRDGLKLVQTFQPDLILLDLRMPLMGGEEMLRRIRMQPWGESLRVIILTNISRDEAPQILRLLRVDRYVVKAHHTPRQISDMVLEILNG